MNEKVFIYLMYFYNLYIYKDKSETIKKPVSRCKYNNYLDIIETLMITSKI